MIDLRTIKCSCNNKECDCKIGVHFDSHPNIMFLHDKFGEESAMHLNKENIYQLIENLQSLLPAQKKPETVFKCRKCGHNLFVSKKKFDSKIENALKKDCPNCGSDGDELWIFSRKGNWDKEKNNFRKPNE